MNYLQMLIDRVFGIPLSRQMEILDVFAVAPPPRRSRRKEKKKFTVQSLDQLNHIGGMPPVLPPVAEVREDN
jgi:hypothetical protein